MRLLDIEPRSQAVRGQPEVMSNSTKHGVKGRVYLTPEQVLLAARQFGCARFVYNHLLNFSQTRYSHNQTKTSPAQRSLELTRIKTALPWLREASAQSLQQTGRALDTAYKNWFDSLMGKRPDKVKPPRFKKKSNRQSARVTRNSVRFKYGVLRLSKIGAIPIVWHRRIRPSGRPGGERTRGGSHRGGYDGGQAPPCEGAGCSAWLYRCIEECRKRVAREGWSPRGPGDFGSKSGV